MLLFSQPLQLFEPFVEFYIDMVLELVSLLTHPGLGVFYHVSEQCFEGIRVLLFVTLIWERQCAQACSFLYP